MHAGGLETHAMACNRHSLVPTSRVAVFADGTLWSQQVATEILNGLGVSGSPDVRGCCSASLWCDSDSCFTHHFGGNQYINSGFFGQPLAIYTCLQPTYEDLHVCTADYTGRCPEGWTAQSSNSRMCEAPDSYHGPCATVSDLGSYDMAAKEHWSEQCDASWPQTCVNLVPPTIESVAMSTVSRQTSTVTVHVEGRGFGDNADAVEVQVGTSSCSDVEVCHTVCRPCSTDAECGTNGLCLTVNNVAGAFCSVFCDTAILNDASLSTEVQLRDSCPCDTQCHSAYAGNNNQVRPRGSCHVPNPSPVFDRDSRMI
jgi:CPW-WPC domain-containing protein